MRQINNSELEAQENAIWDEYLAEMNSAYAIYISACRIARARAYQRSKELQPDLIDPSGPATEPHPMFVGKQVEPL